KRDAKSGYPRAQSAYSEMQDALSPARAEEAKSDPARVDVKSTATQAAPDKGNAMPQAQNVSKLIVGPDIKLKGAEITDCDTLVVEGRVEASMDSRVIQIAAIGMFVGKAGVDTAEIRGQFEGELTARKQLIIRAGGRVTGKIRYGKVS